MFAFAAPVPGFQRSDGDGRRRIPFGGLEPDNLRRDTDGPELFRDQEPVLLVADHDGSPHAFENAEPPSGGLQKGGSSPPREELLGMVFAGERPEPAADTTGENDGEYGAAHPRRLFGHCESGPHWWSTPSRAARSRTS